MKNYCEIGLLCDDGCEHRFKKPYEVIPYTRENLVKVFSKYTKASEGYVSKKAHTLFFEEYFNHHSVKTMIVECEYVDQEFEEDFSEFYVHCFSHYKKKCTRVHFFDKIILPDEFANIFIANKERRCLIKKIKKAYCGFIVLRPLPQTIIGRSCVKAYSELPYRHYRGLDRYDVNLFGIDLHVDTLPFLEQDSVVSACATSALWSVFQATGKAFGHRQLSPSAITKIAYEVAPDYQSQFPSRGLDHNQMILVIRELGLDADFYPCGLACFTGLFKSYMYAHLRSGFPVVLGVTLIDIMGDHSIVVDELHAVTIAGYMRDDSLGVVFNQDICLRSDYIKKIYVHDDGIGPFSRMEFTELPILIEKEKVDRPFPKEYGEYIPLKTAWKVDGTDRFMYAIPDYVITPLPIQVKIKWRNIYDIVYDFWGGVRDAIEKCFGRVSWGIYLTRSNDYKKDILKNSFELKDLEGHLTVGLPLYIWVASATIDGKSILELIFDATAIEQDNFLVHVVCYDDVFFDILTDISVSMIVDGDVSFFCDGLTVLEWFWQQYDLAKKQQKNSRKGLWRRKRRIL